MSKHAASYRRRNESENRNVRVSSAAGGGASTSVLRNALANLAGGVAPAIATIAATPYIVWQLGIGNYGLLTVITAVVGYFAIVDIRISAGAVKFVAEYRAKGDVQSESSAVILSFIVAGVVGGLGGLFILAAAHPLVYGVLDIPPPDQEAALLAIRIAALGFGVTQLENVAVSLPQAALRYPLSASVQGAFGVALPVLTVVALWFGGGLVAVVAVRVISSILSLGVLLGIARRLFPHFVWRLPTRAQARRILSFSGFAYLSSVASVTYQYADKLVIGAILGLEAVSYYAVAATLANRALMLTFRVSSVIYPTASALAATGRWDRLREIYLFTARYVFFVNASIVLLITLFSREILYYWMGPEFAAKSSWVLVLMSLSALVHSVTNLPALVNDGLGHTRITGGFAIVQAAGGLAAISVLAKYAGIVGVALGHLAAGALMGAAFVAFVHGRSIPFQLSEYLRDGYLRAALVVGGLGGGTWLLWRPGLLSLGDTLLGCASVGTVAVIAGVAFVAKPQERAWLWRRLGQTLGQGGSGSAR